MNKFLITIDSACDGNLKELHDKNIGVICYHYSDNTTDYLDDMDNSKGKRFFDEMRNGTKYTTSQLNQYAYYQFFKEQLAFNKNIIHISLTEGLSSSINQARIAIKTLMEEDPSRKIFIIDSLIACNGELLLLDKALELLEQGKEVEESAKELQEFAININTFYTTDTLAYFVRGGRLPKVVGLIGSVLKINPVLTCAPNGNLKVDKQLRGKKAAFNYILEQTKENVINPEEQTLYICHADNLEGAKELAELLKKEVGFKNYKTYLMGPIIGSHTGPGLLAIFFSGKPRKGKK